jgi:hypothetical protein
MNENQEITETDVTECNYEIQLEDGIKHLFM